MASMKPRTPIESSLAGIFVALAAAALEWPASLAWLAAIALGRDLASSRA